VSRSEWCSDLFPSEDPSRCTLDTSGDRDDIRPCAALNNMLSIMRKPFRTADGPTHPTTGEQRFAVVIDLGGSDWRYCDFCPFCGTGIRTSFRREASQETREPAR
jgi:hypothetical protein